MNSLSYALKLQWKINQQTKKEKSKNQGETSSNFSLEHHEIAQKEKLNILYKRRTRKRRKQAHTK